MRGGVRTTDAAAVAAAGGGGGGGVYYILSESPRFEGFSRSNVYFQ